MGTKELRKRAVWQDYSGENAGKAERTFYEAFEREFRGTTFSIRAKPQDFKKIYVDVELSNEELKEIYRPPSPILTHGITPDYAIENSATKKTLYVEVKRQDGWVENKQRSAGRGNAHERSCKYFTPGLLRVLRSRGNLGNDVLPFWTVFIGDITRDPCRVREIALWYEGYSAHHFMWRDPSKRENLIAHFNNHLRRLLV